MIQLPDTLLRDEVHLSRWMRLLSWLEADEVLQRTGDMEHLAAVSRAALEQLGIPYAFLEAT